MKLSKWLMCGLTAMALTAGSALGQETQKAAGDAPKAVKAHGDMDVTRELDLMVKELKLTDDVKAQVKEKLDAKKAAIAAWNDGADGQKLQEQQKALEDARKAGDKAKAESIQKDVKALQRERMDLETKLNNDVLSVLTPDQKTQWQTFNLARMVQMRLGKVQLTDDQVAQVKKICADNLKAVNDAKDQEAKMAAMKTIMDAVKANVLTDDQRKAMEGGHKEKAASEPAK